MTESPLEGIKDEFDAAVSPLRLQLDQTDSALMGCVTERLRICRRIAELKIDYAEPMMQPKRVASVLSKARIYALENHLDEEFLTRLYGLLIEEACRVEDEIIGS